MFIHINHIQKQDWCYQNKIILKAMKMQLFVIIRHKCKQANCDFQGEMLEFNKTSTPDFTISIIYATILHG